MCAGRVLYRLHDGSGVLGEFCIACGVDGWLSDGKQRDKSPDWRLPRGLQGLAGLRADAPSEARSADGERAGRRPRAHQADRYQQVLLTATRNLAARHAKSGGPQENLGATTHAFTVVN